MTTNPRRHKPLITAHRDGADDSGPTFVAAALGAEIAARFGPRDETPLSIVAYDGETVVGGVNGVTHWRWSYIRHFWVAPSWRGRGVGGALLAQAELQALARNCVGLYLDTFDPEAAKFYERRGFARFGQIDDFPPGCARAFLFKRLPATK